MKVLKFGGTSVGTAERMRNILELVRSHFDFIRSFTLDMFTTNEEKDVLAQGELLSTALFHMLCRESAVNAALIQALNFMRTDERGEPSSPVKLLQPQK
jgi:aspartate kinase